ncbi:glutathione-disulfide reductase [Radicibacter daui]|uniref:glutathione-disulfide reductase n=1 Tax=Radicibacter daui TaxID=3064829 RepID=UPI004046D6E9
MTEYDFDLFTIGAGSGGVAASRRAAVTGIKVGICEDYRIGGTCVIRGCVPKKLLVYSAQIGDAITDSAGYGWSVDNVSFDWEKLISAKDKEIDRLNGIYIGMLERAGVHVFEGRGKLIDAHTVEVAGKRYTTKRILIATGGRPVVPDIEGKEHFITSNEALHLESLPRRILIVGGGYIACEFAGIFKGLGAEVTQLYRADLPLRGFDGDVRGFITKELSKRGITQVSGVHPAKLEKTAFGYTLHAADGRTFEADLVMAATGRKPNTDGIGLEAVGITPDKAGAVPVDEFSRTSVSNIWAVGDVTDRVALTPVAIAEARAFVETEYHGNPMAISHENIPHAVFTLPPIGVVGLGEEAAREKYGAVDIYRTEFRPMRNILAGRDERCLMKLVVDRASQRLLGAHMVGPDAPEIIQTLGVAVVNGLTKQQLDRTIALHPSTAEEFVLMRDKLPDPEVAKAAE